MTLLIWTRWCIKRLDGAFVGSLVEAFDCTRSI